MAELHQSSPAELQERLETERRGVPFLLYRDGDGRAADRGAVGEPPACLRGPPSFQRRPVPWDTEVSRVHADIECISGLWTIVDDGRSRNGSFVNGERPTGGGRCTTGTSSGWAARRSRSSRRPSCRDSRAQQRPSASSGRPWSAAQRRVLVALCRPLATGRLAAPASNAQTRRRAIAERGHRQVAPARDCSSGSGSTTCRSTTSARRWRAPRSSEAWCRRGSCGNLLPDPDRHAHLLVERARRACTAPAP